MDLKRRKEKEEEQGERALCCGGVNILELLPAVQKVTANITVCGLDGLSYCMFVCICMFILLCV